MSAIANLKSKLNPSFARAAVVCVAAAAAFAPMLALYLRLAEPTIEHAMLALVAFLLGIVIVCLGGKRH
jgi:hypothetical protein